LLQVLEDSLTFMFCACYELWICCSSSQEVKTHIISWLLEQVKDDLEFFSIS